MTDLKMAAVAALQGKTIATAESCTGGGVGQALTSVPGSSAVFKGGIVSYCDEIKHKLLGVPEAMLQEFGAVSAPVAEAMARGAKAALDTDAALSVTGLAGPGADDFGNPVGTVFIGWCDEKCCFSRRYHFTGDREEVRRQAIEKALQLIVEQYS